MTKRINESEWLVEFDIPPMGGQPDMGAGGPPVSQPGSPGDPMGQQPPLPPTAGNPQDPQQPQPGEPEDLSGDPQYPDMPDQREELDFEKWKIKFVKESIKGNPNDLIDMIQQVRDRDLEPKDRKFVEDNLQICFLRRDASILEASNEIRKMLKKSVDRTVPATTVVGYITEVLEKMPLLNEVYLKTSGLVTGRQDAHRKFIAALLGAIQVGSGADEEDLVFEEADYSIRISTRFNAKWGDVNLGRWYQKEDDPEKFLKPAELDRLESGSPEERDVLRRRVAIESIAERFKERAFVINVVAPDGTVQYLGWDLGSCLKTAFTDGKLVIRTRNSDNKEIFIDEDGTTIAIPTMSVFYVKESQQLDTAGKAGTEEVEFITHRDGMLYLSAQWDLIKEASIAVNGMSIKEAAWTGNPTDLLRLRRCVPSMPELILRQC